jgi:ABC-type lipoprotein export system ATPase subunit
MLSYENVTKDFSLDPETVITPVKDVSLNIGKGEFIIIIGRSGSGKTTLLNLAAGLVRPNSGKVKIDDLDLAEMDDKQLSKLRSQKLGFVFQFPSLLPSLTIQENIALPAIFNSVHEKSGSGKRAASLLDTLGLAGKYNVFPRQLSAGEQKRAVIARALMNGPQLILADEPTSDLDNRTEGEVMEILRDINAGGVTFLIVTHSLQLVPFASRAFKMENGALLEVSTQGVPDVEKVFDAPLK